MKSDKPMTRRICFRLHEDRYRRLELLARDQGVSISDAVRIMVYRYLRDFERFCFRQKLKPERR